MVKSKSKGFKVKEYKVPKEKFLVVVNAWGLSDNFLPSDFNHIGAWFEIMLQDNYPGTRVNAIFYQRTHKNIIVELPSNVDITRYLGAHHYSKFLRYPPNDPRIAYLYEYRYSTFGNPGNKNWSDVSPTYQSIPSGIPIIYPYPSPLPAPNPSSDVPYARSISADLHNQLVLAQTLANIAADLPPLPAEPNLGQKSQRSPSTPTSSLPKQIVQSDRDARPTPAPTPDKGKNRQVEPPTPAERSDTSSSLFTPYVPPSHYSAITGGSTSRHSEINPPPNIKKMDPYEEAEVAEALLRSLSPVKRDEADEFLRSFSLPGTTREEDNELVDSPMSSKDPTNGSLVDEEEDYKPSADLMELLNSLPPEANMVESFFAEPMIEEGTSVKAEPVETVPCDSSFHVKEEPLDDEYTPSGGLLAAMAMIPDDMEQGEHGQKPHVVHECQRAHSQFMVKEEPSEFSISDLPSSNHDLPSQFESSRSTTLDIDRYGRRGRQEQDDSSVRVKLEQQESDDSRMHLSFVSDGPRRGILTAGVPESSSHSRSKDPRKRGLSTNSIKQERQDNDNVKNEGYVSSKRLKSEQ